MRHNPARNYALIITKSPYIDRAGIRAKQQIIETMADDLRVIAANRGDATEKDMKTLGWSTQQIASYGDEAAQLAYRQAAA